MKNKSRPVKAGVTESRYGRDAGTAGPLAEVVDTSCGVWDDSVEEGDTVRLSSAHIYTQELGVPVTQPSTADGGDPFDEVGRVCGYVPIEDGVTVDVAARTTNDHDADSTHGFRLSSSSGVARDAERDFRGEDVTLVGRTQNVSVATVRDNSTSRLIGYQKTGATSIEDVLLVDRFSQWGDSGAPVFHEKSGQFVGMLVAGSDEYSIVCKAKNIESSLGVSF